MYTNTHILTLDEKKLISKKRQTFRARRRKCIKCNWLRRQREFGRIGRSKFRKQICIYCEQTQAQQARITRAVKRSRRKPQCALMNPKSLKPILAKKADIPQPVPIKAKSLPSLNPMADAKDKRRGTFRAIFKRCLRNPISYAPILVKRCPRRGHTPG